MQVGAWRCDWPMSPNGGLSLHAVLACPRAPFMYRAMQPPRFGHPALTLSLSRPVPAHLDVEHVAVPLFDGLLPLRKTEHTEAHLHRSRLLSTQSNGAGNYSVSLAAARLYGQLDWGPQRVCHTKGLRVYLRKVHKGSNVETGSLRNET